MGAADLSTATGYRAAEWERTLRCGVPGAANGTIVYVVDTAQYLVLADGEWRHLCGARAVFWPDDEACEAVCSLPAGHEPADIHEDHILGVWKESELPTEPGAVPPGGSQ